MNPAEVEEQMRRAYSAARRLQAEHANQAVQYGRMAEVFTVTKPYYVQAARQQASDLAFAGVIHSGMANVAAITSSLESAAGDVGIIANRSVPVWSAVVSFAGSAAATINFHPVAGLKLDEIAVTLQPDERFQHLGERLEKIDPSLRPTCDQIFNDLYGTTGDPIRAAAFMTRQVWDHFFDRLSPKDDEVRKSKHWKLKEGKDKPDAVSRAERVKCAIDKHVTDAVQHGLLHGAADSMCDTYNDLNTAHARAELNAVKARSAVAVLYRWLLQWADALNL